jgi:hypothetical protein
MLFFLLSVFMLCFWNGKKNQSTTCYVLAFLAAVYSTYMKEPVFGMIAIIALTHLIFGYKKLTEKDKLFHHALLINSLIYLIIYVCVWLCNPPMDLYNDSCVFSFHILKRLLKNERILGLLCLLCLVRLYFFLIRGDRDHLFWDSLLFAATGYFCAFVCLRLVRANYYFFLSAVLALPSFAHWTSHFWKKNRVVAVGIMLLAVVSVHKSAVASITGTRELWRCRQTNMVDIREIVRQYQNGAEIIWSEESGGDSWVYYAFENFVEYCLGKKEVHIVKKYNEYETIPQKSIILHHALEKNKDTLDENFNDFYSVGQLGIYDWGTGVKVYVHKGMEWKGQKLE